MWGTVLVVTGESVVRDRVPACSSPHSGDWERRVVCKALSAWSLRDAGGTPPVQTTFPWGRFHTCHWLSLHCYFTGMRCWNYRCLVLQGRVLALTGPIRATHFLKICIFFLIKIQYRLKNSNKNGLWLIFTFWCGHSSLFTYTNKHLQNAIKLHGALYPVLFWSMINCLSHASTPVLGLHSVPWYDVPEFI